MWYNIYINFDVLYMREGSSIHFHKNSEQILGGQKIRKEQKREGRVAEGKRSSAVYKNPEFYDEAGRVKPVGLGQEQLTVNAEDVISLEDYKARHDGDGRQSATKMVKGDPKRFRRLNKVQVGMGK